MDWNLTFFINSILFGIGLAMDAFSVSMANGLNEPHMKRPRMCLIAGTFCVFQAIMPLIGWLCIHTIAQTFTAFQRFIPWIALILLSYIGGKMLIEGIHDCRKGSSEVPEAESEKAVLGFGALMVQGIATAIDALSVGFTIADYDWIMALAESIIIGLVTFIICLGGLVIGKTVGNRLSGKASILGGVILIAIGLEIFLTA